MREKIVLIDGHSILHRAFYGIPDLTNAAGLHTNAIYGFLNILFKILDEEQPEYLIVAFDVHAPTFRHKMYEPYKGTRKPMAEELRQQVPVLKEVLTAMGIHIVELPGYEADDLLGTIATRSEKAGLKVALVSGDRDLLQLASEFIKIRIPKTKRTGTEIEDYYAADVVAKMQVTPREYIDVKALMGDSSDNIPGVPGIGEKTATSLIVTYKSIENAYAHVDEIKPNRAKEALANHFDLAQLSKTLATIILDCPIEYDLASAKRKDFYTKAAYLKFRELEFKNMLSRFETVVSPEPKTQNFGWITQAKEALAVFLKAKEEEKVAFWVAQVADRCYGISLTMQKEASVFLKVGTDLSEDMLLDELRQLLHHQQKRGGAVVTIDLKSQLRFLSPKPFVLQELGLSLKDIKVGAYLLNPLKGDYDYADIAKDFGGRLLPDRKDLFGKQSDAAAALEQTEEFLAYLCYHSSVAYNSWDQVFEQLKETAMDRLFEEIEMPLVYTLYNMETFGVRVKEDELKAYGDTLAVQIKKLEQEIYEDAGEIFNINSPKQLGVILFEKLKMPGGKKTKTGYSTAADVLDKLAPDYPLVPKILEYRQLTKLKSTYADGLANCIAADGRIHSCFSQTTTATGRLSSIEPNLQNIPIKMEIGRLIRKVFVPKEGFVLVDADYSQIELRVLAHMSADKSLIEAYRQAQDIHRITASQVFNTAFEEVTSLQRRNAKAVNFGIVYGISSFGLSQDLSITKKEAASYIDKYFETYPGIKIFLDKQVENAKEYGYVTTIFGRRRPVPEISSSNFIQRSFGERVAMNSPIQGTAADIIKIAMISVERRLREAKLRSRLILQVHDELLIEAASDEVEKVKEVLRQAMESAAALSVVLEIDMKTGENWYDAH
jgi:DNA polymerase-1